MSNISLKTEEEIEKLAIGGKILGEVLAAVGKMVKPGVSTFELDQVAEKMLLERGARPSFKGYRDYPAALCTSVNEEVVHGIPSKERILKAGDMVGLDIGAEYEGLYTDMAQTYPVGKVDKKTKQLIAAAREALEIGIEMARPGKTVGDIGNAIQQYAKSQGFKVIRHLAGHGVGHRVHEDPLIPNFGTPGMGDKLVPGMVIAIEPMLVTGDWVIDTLADKWTVITVDGGWASHFEKTLAITEDGSRVLTPFVN